jgi:hypothetical protein
MGGIGSGFLLIPVLVLCVVALGPSILTVIRKTWIPLASGASYLFLQLVVHEESWHTMYVYQFGPWLMSLVIVQALATHRPNFLHRFAFFTLLIGLAMVPFMSSLHLGGGPGRVGLVGGVGLAYSNPNALAGWFGFCALYLIIRGYIETRPGYRAAAWLMAVGALYAVALTVSRGTLLALAGSLLVSSRKLLKEGLFPLLLLTVLVLGLVQSGLFDQAIEAFSVRGTRDSGRLQVWPLLIEKFINSPLIGHGASAVGAFTEGSIYRTPHNGFLLFAVASGIVPLVLFCAYCFRSGLAALRANAADQDFIFYLPLFVYTLLYASAGNMEFMVPWAVVSLALPVAANFNQLHQKEKKSLRTHPPV